MRELGYIKIEDVLELVKLVHRVHMETEHYASIDFCSHETNVVVSVYKEGWARGKEPDLFGFINIYNPWDYEREAERFCRIRNYLKALLEEKKDEKIHSDETTDYSLVDDTAGNYGDCGSVSGVFYDTTEDNLGATD